MAFALPVWFAVQQELLVEDETDFSSPSVFDHFDDETLFQTFHLSRPCVTFILDSVRPRLNAHTPLPADAMLMVALNYYAHGVSIVSVLQRVGLSQTECPAVIGAVSEVIADMADVFISFPTSRESRTNVASKIQAFCGIPRVLGVLAPAHFKIRASPYEKDIFRSFVNSQGYTSVVTQIICDCDGNILSVEKCCVGSTSEQEIWDASFKRKEMEQESGGSYWIAGGSGYRLTMHVLTAVSQPTNKREVLFNEAHAKLHDAMRSTLNNLKRRFRCLMQLGFAQEMTLNRKANIIKACCVLHNICKKFSVHLPPAVSSTESLLPGKHSVLAEVKPDAIKARQELISDCLIVGSNSTVADGEK
ncbi:putative nuclease HARBI1 [Thalassophryne amazonica]|uniref:putative nuclease HARBI1 n=1 Tax=Thalassophryne amazonica TaxID=390379 RepID=UPI0014722A5B|nr:putative nuclease HARBI1 [Thalassophryne amazonica]XP_034050166.1 putative nuclease HARBI1 [Thalassophryne amazonica]